MTKALKLIFAMAIAVAWSTASLAQDVPLNTTVSGGQGAEVQVGQGAAAAGSLVITPGLVIGVVVVAVAIATGGGDGSSTTTTN